MALTAPPPISFNPFARLTRDLLDERRTEVPFPRGETSFSLTRTRRMAQDPLNLLLEGYEREGDVFMPGLTMAPSAYFKRQCYVSIEPDETPARAMLEAYGADQIVFSTDYPHGDSRYPGAVDAFLELPLSDEDKRKILWDNCARFYGVAGAPA